MLKMILKRSTIIILIFIFLISFVYSQRDKIFVNQNEIRKQKIEKLKILINEIEKKINILILKEKQSLKNNAFDFYSENPKLLKKIDEEFLKLTDEEKIGMIFMIEYDKNTIFSEIYEKIKKYHIGGVIFLKNNSSKELLEKVESANTSNLKLIFASDAESSLLKYRFSNFERKNKYIGNTSDIKSTSKSIEVAKIISEMLYRKGFDVNFAPVYDIDKNKSVISNRSFSTNNKIVQKLANAFMIESQKNKIVATAKHFPGHGNVVGDSHKKLPTIFGDLIELDNFKTAIKNKVVLMMIGHLKISENKRWNTDNLPSSLSSKIVNDLLKKELDFKGIVITDAMNMGAVAGIKNAEIKALDAGVDIILMPKNLEKIYNEILFKMKNNLEFSKKIDKKVKKIIKLKIILMINRKEMYLK